VPVLAIAGDVDPIFPPNQVKAYARKVDAEYHVFGDASSPRDDPDTHYSHYDVICGRHAPHKVFPIVAEFLER
jgi:pimeloyl-ACP methyl ester carboxylesterase